MNEQNAREHTRRSPRVFISYSWEGDEHRKWVIDLARRLHDDGVDVRLDQWSLAPGDQIPAFMERSVTESDFVLVVCTPTYKAKSDHRLGGVGYEGDIITGSILAEQERRKFIPVWRTGAQWIEAAPSWLLGALYIDMRPVATDLNTSYERLLLHLHDAGPKPPPVGEPLEGLIESISAVAPMTYRTRNVSGRWIDSAEYDTIYFKQIGNRAVGIFNYGNTRKTGALVGTIENQIFEFSWHWFEMSYRGSGRMKITNEGRLMVGIWWYETKANLIDHVGYRYVSPEMPEWLTESDFEELANHLTV